MTDAVQDRVRTLVVGPVSAACPGGWIDRAGAKVNREPDQPLVTGFLIEEFERSGLAVDEVAAVPGDDGLAAFPGRRVVLDADHLNRQCIPHATASARQLVELL